MFKIVESYQQSGLSQPVFCPLEGLNKKIFFYWLKKYCLEKQGDFLPLKVNEAKPLLAKYTDSWRADTCSIHANLVNPANYGSLLCHAYHQHYLRLIGLSSIFRPVK
ncbi:MAG: hypothetical protein J7L94_15410 [Caldisericaceae bacterium]|nr:hypothetical protein [Caldisericaceae bacterium]